MSANMHQVEWLLRLYPQDWRERYGEEFAALLEQCPFSPLTILDVLFGALDAHLDPEIITEGMWPMTRKLRGAEIALFGAFIGYVLAGLAFNGLLDDNPLSKVVAHTHLDLGAAVLGVQAGAVLALVAILAGGLPIGYTALRRALAERRRDILWLFAVPPLSLAVLILYFAAFAAVTLASRTPINFARFTPRPVVIMYFGGVGLFVLAAVASTTAVALAVARSRLGDRLLRFALIPGALAALAMALTLAAVVTWGLRATADAPRTFNSAAGLFGLSTAISWSGIVTAMALATAVASVAALRGIRARATTRASQ